MQNQLQQSDLLNSVDHYLETRLDAYINEVAALCAQPSVSATGVGIQACATLVEDTLRNRGFTVTCIETPGNPVIVGRLGDINARTLLFYNHYDVQPPEPLDLWTTPPFAPEIRDGALYARGARDDKGEFIARLAAVDAVREAHGGDLPVGILFVVEGEEEAGSPYIAQMVRENRDLLRCDASIWEEGGIDTEGAPVNYLGGRGLLVVELSVKTMKHDAHSGGAHIMPSAAWRLTWALASLKDQQERVLIPGFYDGAMFPSELDLHLLDLLPDREVQLRESTGTTRFVNDLSGRDLNRAVFNPTCNIQGIETGYTGKGFKTVLPAEARARIDFRLIPGQNPDDIFQKLRAHLDAQGFADVEVRQLGQMLPHITPADDPFIELVSHTGEAIYGKPSRLTPLVGGSSPMYAFGDPLNIPIARAGVGYWDNRQHAPDEHLRLVDFLNGARHIARIIDGFATI